MLSAIRKFDVNLRPHQQVLWQMDSEKYLRIIHRLNVAFDLGGGTIGGRVWVEIHRHSVAFLENLIIVDQLPNSRIRLDITAFIDLLGECKPFPRRFPISHEPLVVSLLLGETKWRSSFSGLRAQYRTCPA